MNNGVGALDARKGTNPRKMGSQTNLPAFIPKEPPNHSILDFSGTLSPDQLQGLEVLCKGLSFKAWVVIPPKDYILEDPAQLSYLLEQQWHTQDNTLLLLVNLQGRNVFALPEKYLVRAGLNDKHINQELIPQYFVPSMSAGDLNSALRETLLAADQRVFTSYAYKTYGTSLHPPRKDMLVGPSFGLLATFLIILVAVILLNRRKTSASAKPIELVKATNKFKTMVQEIEELSSTRPKFYLMQVIGLAALGYAYIWFVLAILGIVCAELILLFINSQAISAPYVALKLGIILFGMICSMILILRSFWIKSNPVNGILLDRNKHPDIFSLIENIRHAINAPPIHHIIVTPNYNAAVIQESRLGPFGWHRNYLLIGMPLALAVPYKQMEAILAHELGHLAKNHGVISSWVYALRVTWLQLLNNLSGKNSIASMMMTRFFSWYSPYFNAFTFVLARTQEYHADECSVHLTGKETVALALTGAEVKERFLSQKYIPKILEGVKHSIKPPSDIFSGTTKAINCDLTMQEAEVWLTQHLSRKTDYHDTHPSLSDRLTAVLQIAPEQVEKWVKKHLPEIYQVDESAAHHLFGRNLPELLDSLNRSWQEQMVSVRCDP